MDDSLQVISKLCQSFIFMNGFKQFKVIHLFIVKTVLSRKPGREKAVS